MSESYEGWAILELMGHRRLGGRVSQVEQYGTAMLRIDIPSVKEGEDTATQFYGGAAIYCVTPTTEEMARAVALRNQRRARLASRTREWPGVVPDRLRWCPDGEFLRVADGIPDELDRYKGLGNAVVPQVAEWIARRIKDAL